MKRERRFKGLSIGWKLAAYLLFFVALTLLVVWLFQIRLLDLFFEGAKKKELRRTATELSESLGQEDLELQARVFASERTMGISIYQIDGANALPVVSVDAMGDGKMQWIRPDQLDSLYQKALENNGIYETKIAFGGKEVKDDGFGFLPPDRENYKDRKIPAKNIRLVHILLEEEY